MIYPESFERRDRFLRAADHPASPDRHVHCRLQSIAEVRATLHPQVADTAGMAVCRSVRAGRLKEGKAWTRGTHTVSLLGQGRQDKWMLRLEAAPERRALYPNSRHVMQGRRSSCKQKVPPNPNHLWQDESTISCDCIPVSLLYQESVGRQDRSSLGAGCLIAPPCPATGVFECTEGITGSRIG
jgi:hypothetical protein